MRSLKIFQRISRDFQRLRKILKSFKGFKVILRDVKEF